MNVELNSVISGCYQKITFGAEIALSLYKARIFER